MTGTYTVIGMGNTEMGDDGIGAFLVERLREDLESGRWKPAGSAKLELVVAGADPVLAGACIAEAERALLLDASDMKVRPGESRLFSAENARRDAGFEGSTHTVRLAEILAMIRGLGFSSRLKLMGIQPADMRQGTEISAQVLRKVPEMLERIKEEVSPPL